MWETLLGAWLAGLLHECPFTHLLVFREVVFVLHGAEIAFPSLGILLVLSLISYMDGLFVWSRVIL